jgi:hypothetical protein
MITCGPQVVSGAPIFGGGGVPSSRTIAGLDLSVDRSALAMRGALRPLTVDTIPSATPWVTRNGEGAYAGTATVNVGGSIDFSCLSASSQTVAAAARAPWLLRPATLIAMRISAFTGTAAGDQIFIGLTNVINVQNPISLVNVCGNDACYMLRDGGSTTTSQTVSGITDGQGWAILVARGGDVDGFVAIGSGGAFPQDDSTWTYLGTIARGESTRDPWPLVCVQMVRDGSSGNVTATVSDFTYGVWL